MMKMMMLMVMIMPSTQLTHHQGPPVNHNDEVGHLSESHIVRDHPGQGRDEEEPKKGKKKKGGGNKTVAVMPLMMMRMMRMMIMTKKKMKGDGIKTVSVSISSPFSSSPRSNRRGFLQKITQITQYLLLLE